MLRRLPILFTLLVLAYGATGSNSSALSPSNFRPGLNTSQLPPTDDGSSAAIPIGFTVNFFGQNYSSLYINNNGSITFNAPFSDYRQTNLANTKRAIIAPFFADVDTRPAGQSTPMGAVVTYGMGIVNGFPAFGVTWPGVGYYNQHTDKLDNFQLVLIQRSDRGSGEFDIEFNYDQIQWETGDANGGSGGLGGASARVGYASGSGSANSFELPGSGVPGSFLDANTATGLIHGSLNSNQNGRYVIPIQNLGIPSPSPSPSSSPSPSPSPSPTTSPSPKPPFAEAISPTRGSSRGGTPFQITGANFVSGATVTFGNRAATGVSVSSDGTSIMGMTPSNPVVGDVNGDRMVNAVDALCILRLVAGLGPAPSCPQSALNTAAPVVVTNPNGMMSTLGSNFVYNNGDVNGDGVVTAVDALCILRIVAGLPATTNCPAPVTAQTAASAVLGSANNEAAPPVTGPSLAAAAPIATVGRQATETMIKLGESTTVTVTLKAPSAQVGSWAIILSYDSAILKATGCKAAGSNSTCSTSAAGSVRISGSSVAALRNGDILATIAFEGVGSAGSSSQVVASIGSLNNVNGNPLNIDSGDEPLTIRIK
ncbi:MAG: nidogen-like domain-containing protein [Dehalococcoidia bacterium]